MPRVAKPWFRKADGWWYLNLRKNGEVNQVRLAEGRKARDAAYQRYYELMAEKAAEKQATPLPVRTGDPPTAWQCIDKFLKFSEANNAPRTYKSYKDFLDDFAAHIGPEKHAGIDRNVPVELDERRIRILDVTEWLDGKPGWGPSTKSGAIGAVRRAFRWCTEVHYIPAYPLFGMRAARKATREVIISEEEFRNLIAAIKDHQFRNLIQFAWQAGCRPQESCGIDIEHFKLATRRLVIPTSQAKGKKAPRVIFLNDVALAIVVGAIGDRKSGPIFRNKRGRRWTKNAVKCRFARLEEKVGKRYCAYHLRHSWVTAGLEQGVDSIVLGVLAGHRDPSQIAKTYQHLAQKPDFLLDAASKVRPEAGK